MTLAFASLALLAATTTMGDGPPVRIVPEHGCDAVPSAGEDQEPTRPATVEDLAALRDIGSSIELAQEPPFTVSPDGQQVAFQLRRADPAHNRYCLAMLVAPLHAATGPIVIDRGGEAIRWTFPAVVGKADFPTGFPRPITPRWLAASRQILFLKQDADGIQIWRAAADGTSGIRITEGPDVADFRSSADGREVIYAIRSGAAEAAAALAREGLSGYHFDDRFSPVSRSVPFPAGPLPLSYRVLELATGQIRAATADEQALLPPPAADARPAAISPSGRAARLQPRDANRFPPQQQLVVDDLSGRPRPCADPACIDLAAAPWWSADGTSVFFLRHDGWARAQTAIYEWRIDDRPPRRLLVTDDLLLACQTADAEIICLDESSARPRRLVAFSIDTGESRTVFDPNPVFATLSLGRVERLRWRGTDGGEIFSDLVYPVGYIPGRRYPLIVVQYNSRGFLRGGTGDEYPIQAFAARGYAVLSFEKPEPVAVARGARNSADRDRTALRGFEVRWANLRAIEQAVHRLIERGLVDRTRVGISGLSDGASTVQFAGLHSQAFRAAIVSSCCWDESQDAVVGPAIARLYHGIGWPRLGRRASTFWSAMSWTTSTRPIAFPVLMQLPDREFLAALPAVTAMRDRGDPVDLYVFPDEHHVKWQPAHRLAVYRRALAWFDFWLRGIDPPATDLAETRRWQALASRPKPLLPGSAGRTGNGARRRNR